METQAGIRAAAVKLPAQKRTAESLFQEESASFDSSIASRLGIEEVPICDGESASALAMAACQEALARAELAADQLDLIVDYSILPQEFLVPAWNMSNKLQHELGAKKAFTVGFSGGGATNFLVALSSAAAMLSANEKLQYALLVAADVTIPGNRVLNPDHPVTLLGDSASAVILQKGVEQSILIDTELRSEGSYHSICYIPGGALAHPDDPALYRLQLDTSRYEGAPKAETLQEMLGTLLQRHDVNHGDISYALYPNLSHKDQLEFSKAMGLNSEQLDHANCHSHGHLQGTDFVLNYLSMMENGTVGKGQYFIAASHGMGFLAGVSLLRM